jgi:hypothetical protein
MTRALIIHCSHAKRPFDGKLIAIDLYNGPTFKLIRRYLKESSNLGEDRLDIFILSAKYGLIDSDKEISPYDLSMTPERVKELMPQVEEKMAEILKKGYEEIFISLGKVYLSALEPLRGKLGTNVKISQASQGKRLRELRLWLYRENENEVSKQKEPVYRVTGQATLKGKQIKMTREEILTRAREALKDGTVVNTYKNWYLLVDGQKVSTKWLVSLLFDVSTREFQASDARRVLGQLGIDVFSES